MEVCCRCIFQALPTNSKTGLQQPSSKVLETRCSECALLIVYAGSWRLNACALLPRAGILVPFSVLPHDNSQAEAHEQHATAATARDFWPRITFAWCLITITQQTHTPSVALRRLPPNSARVGYATEGAVFIPAQLSSDAVSALRKVWVLIRLWKQHGVQART